MKDLATLLAEPVAVLGVGVTGRAVADFLESRGSDFDLYDDKEGEYNGRVISTFSEPIRHYGLAIISPGWKRSQPRIQSFLQSDIRLISEIDFAWLVKSEAAPGQKWVALTGTNGKTTTIQMLQSIMDAAGVKGQACANVGIPAIAAVAQIPALDYLALELSSFQIEWSELPHYEAVAILNIAEDHIDWHETFDNYANAKMSLIASSDCAILNAQDPEIATRSTSFQGKKIFYSLDTPMPHELGLVEDLLVDRAFVADSEEATLIAELKDIHPQVPHNVSNALAASGIALAMGIPHEFIKKGLSAFTLDHHRLEEVLERDGVKWINDSKATNPHAAIAGILANSSVIWVAGGLAKGATMDALVKRAAPRLKAAILIGTDKELIAEALTLHAPEIPLYRVEGDGDPESLMRAIIGQAKELATKDDVVLLAPACASMDQFDSYAHRGELFAQAVREMIGRE